MQIFIVSPLYLPPSSVFINSKPRVLRWMCVEMKKEKRTRGEQDWTRSLDWDLCAGNEVNKKKEENQRVDYGEAKTGALTKDKERTRTKNHFQSSRFVCEANSVGEKINSTFHSRSESRRCLWKLLRDLKAWCDKKAEASGIVYTAQILFLILTPTGEKRKKSAKSKALLRKSLNNHLKLVLGSMHTWACKSLAFLNGISWRERKTSSKVFVLASTL